MAKKTLIEFDDLSDEAKKALADFTLDLLSQTLAPSPKDEEAEESEAAEDEEEEDAEEEDGEEEESDDEEESEDDEEEDGDEEEEDEEDDNKKGKKKGKKDADEEDDEEEEESEDDEDEDGEDSEDDEEESDEEEDGDDEEGDDDDPMTAIQAELESIPESLFKQAKTESAAVNAKEAKAEMVEYFTRRDVPAKDAKAMVDGLKEKDLKACYADYYARFLDTDGEVHDKDDPYKALRIVKGKEVAVWCCNGVGCVDGKCVVNPKVKVPADKKKAGKVIKKKSKK